MNSSAKIKWLEEGYKEFALNGPDLLSINQISKAIGSSRASFYHFFGDREVLIEELLAAHWDLCIEFNQTGREKCTSLFPDLYALLGEYTIPLQFSLQLFHNRHIPQFNYLFTKSYASSARAFAVKLFADHMGLNPEDPTVYNLWVTMGEAWYSRLDPADLSSPTLQRHSEKIIKTLTGFIQSELYNKLHVDN